MVAITCPAWTFDLLYQKRVVVSVGGNGVVIVADQNQLTVAADFFANVDNGTCCGGTDLLALCLQYLCLCWWCRCSVG